MRVRRKLQLIVAFSVAAALIVAGVIASSAWVSAQAERRTEAAGNLARDLMQMRLLAFDFAFTHDARDRRQWLERHTAVSRQLAAAGADELGDAARRSRIAAKSGHVRDALAEIADRREKMPTEYEKQVVGRLLVLSQDLVTDAQELSAAALRDAQVQRDRLSRVALPLAIACALAIPLTVWLVLGGLGRSLRELQDGIEIIGDGDLSHRIALDGGDEIGEIARNFNTMADSLAASHAQLTEEIRARDQAERKVREVNADLEQRIEKRTGQLAHANQELETFAYTVAHDLKAPLRGIHGYCKLLQESQAGALDAEGHKFLANVLQGAQQMHELIEDLLSYSRMERRPLAPADLDLPALVDAVVRRQAAVVGATEIRIDVPPLIVRADRDVLALAIGQLLDNALKFSREATPPVVAIGARDEAGRTMLWVSDNGIGFDMKFHDRIFEIFARLQRAEDYPGTGVGLALVRKSAQRMGGAVRAESSPGKGATFFLEIPK